jgi:glycosyltransferase 2 family protein
LKTVTKNIIKVSISLLIGGAFLWLAMRNIDIREFGETWSKIQTHWVVTFVVLTLASFWFRMERWKLLAEHDRIPSRRSVLFAGVLNGYAVNYAVPRLGEITRCYYVAKKEDKPVAAIMGTVVLERIIDLGVLILLMMVVFFFVFTDTNALVGLLGLDTTEALNGLYTQLGLLTTLGLVAVVLGWWLLGKLAGTFGHIRSFRTRLITFGTHFKDGLLSIRNIQHPIRFLVLTAALWSCYIAMAGVPFTMLPGSGLENLGLVEALVITVVSSVGVAIPAPGGIGTYHLFVQKSLYILYGIPEITGFTYALASHALVFVIVMITTPIALVYVGRRRFVHSGN